MKPRLFLGNFDFEHQLCDPTGVTPIKLQRLNAELACAWMSIAEDGDYVWTPLPFDSDYLGRLGSNGLPKAIPVTSLSEIPQDIECVPWGWSTNIRQLAERFGWCANAPSDAAVRIANARSTSDNLERMWQIGLPGAQRIESVADFRNAIPSSGRFDDRWVVKAEFGMSARERILGHGLARLADENWVNRRLASSKFVFFEPWVERLDEVGIQIDVPCIGQPRLLGLTPMIVDQRGQYAGSWFAADDSKRKTDRILWSEAVEVALRAAEYLQSIGYFGPLGIDAMVYRDREGIHRIRPLQDINARWTMGRLSLGWRELLHPGDLGVWQHCSADDVQIPQGIRITRQLKTSPDQIGGVPSQRMSRVVIQAVRELCDS